MLARRKARMAAAPPILRGGFRPFFMLGSAWALFALLAWLCALLHGVSIPSGFSALAWHRHEMLFGFVGAIVAGFLLTAVPNWTGRLPIAGSPLGALVGLWLAARIAVYFSATVSLIFAALLDVGFYLAFAFIAGREVIAARNRNLPIVVLVLLFAVADALDYGGTAGVLSDGTIGFRGGIALVVIILSVVGGRIIPSFTRNWMTKRGFTASLPGQPTTLDRTAIGMTVLALVSWLAMPVAMWSGLGLIFAGLLQVIRVGRWRGWLTWRDPLVIVLHVGYVWVPLGLLLLGASILSPQVPRTAAIHALTVGAMTTMVLAVMTRASLGHTGRELKANAMTVVAYLSITFAALFRVATSLQLLEFRIGIEGAGLCWAVAFVAFLWVYVPILTGPRAGQ